jgi:hypothetical protein
MRSKFSKNYLRRVFDKTFNAIDKIAKLVEQIGQAAARHGLHNKAEIVGALFAPNKLDDVRVLEVAEVGCELGGFCLWQLKFKKTGWCESLLANRSTQLALSPSAITRN